MLLTVLKSAEMGGKWRFSVVCYLLIQPFSSSSPMARDSPVSHAGLSSPLGNNCTTNPDLTPWALVLWEHPRTRVLGLATDVLLHASQLELSNLRFVPACGLWEGWQWLGSFALWRWGSLTSLSCFFQKVNWSTDYRFNLSFLKELCVGGKIAGGVFLYCFLYPKAHLWFFLPL